MTITPMKYDDKIALYKFICAGLDNIMKLSGINDICIKCQQAGQGCCSGCRHLGPKGCTSMSVSCKLWLCTGSKLQENRPTCSLYIKLKKSPHYPEYLELRELARANGWVNMYTNPRLTIHEQVRLDESS